MSAVRSQLEGNIAYNSNLIIQDSLINCAVGLTGGNKQHHAQNARYVDRKVMIISN